METTTAMIKLIGSNLNLIEVHRQLCKSTFTQMQLLLLLNFLITITIIYACRQGAK